MKPDRYLNVLVLFRGMIYLFTLNIYRPHTSIYRLRGLWLFRAQDVSLILNCHINPKNTTVLMTDCAAYGYFGPKASSRGYEM